MALVDMNPGQLFGTILLVAAFAVMYPSLQGFIDLITQNSSGVTQLLSELIIPAIVVTILANLWGPDERV